MYRILKYGTVATLGLAIAWGWPHAASTAKAQSMYKGKTITLLIGYGFGGTYGKYARLMSKHLPNHIAGKPNIIVQSMPGAGGLKAANYAYSVMPKQGFHIIEPPDPLVVSQLMRPNKVKFHAPDFTWLGGTNQTNSIFVLRKDSGVTKWQDMRKIEVIAGNTGPGSSSYMVPRLMKVMLKLKIKPISGYKGSRKTILAMEQGEHQGTGFNWLAWNSIAPHWFSKEFGGTAEPGKEQAIPLMQMGHFNDPDLPNVPMLGDVVDAKYKPIVSFMATHGLIGRGLVMPPGVSKKVIKQLRASFDNMVKDPAYKSESKKRGLRVIASSGEDIQKMVNDVFKNSDPKIIAQARAIIFPKKK